MPHDKSISVYLHDHLAGASSGVDIAEQAAERHRDDELGEFFAPLAEQIRADHALIKDLVAGLNAATEDARAAQPADDELSLDIDLPALASRFGHRLHDADMPVTVSQAELFVRSLQLMQPSSRRELYFATRAIFVTDFEDVPTFDRVFADVFGAGPSPDAVQPPPADALDEVRAMNAQRHTYRRHGWPARSASTWVEGDPDRRRLPRATDADAASDADARPNPHLHDIFSLETLSAGIEGTLSMWKALHNINAAHPVLAAIDFAALEARAETQRALVEEMIREIAPQALANELVAA